jgi:hypothetical protein
LNLSNDHPKGETDRSTIHSRKPNCLEAVIDRSDTGLALCASDLCIISPDRPSRGKCQSLRTMGRWRTSTCVVLSVFWLFGCTDAKIPPANAVPGPSPSPDISGPTATDARKQNWGCPRIERAITSLIEPMRAAKTRAETEQKQAPPTLARVASRLTGPPGGGNAALTEFQKMRNDASQLNGLLREKGCAERRIDIQAPAFLNP